MGLFNQLKPMLPKGGTILLSLAAVGDDGDKLRLTITPVLGEDDRPDGDDKTAALLSRPVVVTATADELDVELIDHLTRYFTKRESMREEFEALDKELEDAKKEAKEAIAAEKKRADKGVPTIPTPPPIVAKPVEKPAPAALF